MTRDRNNGAIHAGRLLLRGVPAADHQWRFSCTIHNLLKLHRNRALAAITAT